MRTPRTLASRLRGWGSASSQVTGFSAAAWSAGYGLLGAFWWSGGSRFPYGVGNDPAAPTIAALGFIGTVVGVSMARSRGRGWLRGILTAFGLSAAFVLALLVPDYRVFIFVAYTPIVLLGTPFGLDPGVLADVLTPAMLNQMGCITGGLVWAAASIGYWRRTAIRSPRGDRTDYAPHWITPEGAAAWGKWATYVAAAVPIVYALTRYAWALGIPLGISGALFRQGQASGLWLFGAALATLAVVGAILTLGLVQRWSEVFPRWIPILGGRRVPLALVIVPASTVAVLVTNAGLMFWRITLAGGFLLGDMLLTLDDNWAALAPELLWPVWGAALGGASLAYYVRRRASAY